MPQKGIHWVRPVLVAQIGFSEWTGDGKLRHPRYLGLRDDKDASQVIREGPSA
jgi:ATP-dependent DNA ligase